MPDFLFFTDLSQLQYVLDENPSLLVGKQILTGDMAVAERLEQLAIPFIDEWSCLNSQQIQQNSDLAHDLACRWWKENLSSSFADLERFFLNTRCEMIWPLESCINACCVYDQLFRDQSSATLYGFFLPKTPLLKTGPANAIKAATALSQSVLLWYAKKAGMKIKKLQSGRSLSIESLVNPPPPGPQQELITNRVVISSGSAGSFTITRDPSKNSDDLFSSNSVIVVENILHRAEQFELTEIIKSLRLDVLRVWLAETDQLPFPWHLRDWEETLKKAWKEWNAASTSYTGPWPAIFSNPHIRFQFRAIWKTIATSIRISETFGLLLDRIQPKVVIFGHEAFTLERSCVNAARKRRIPTVSLLHGGMVPAVSRKGVVGDSDHIMAWNDWDARQLIHYGMDSGRIRVVGAIKYKNGIPNHLEKKTINNPVTSENSNPCKILFVTASVNAGFASPRAHPVQYRETWQELIVLAGRRVDYQFVIKPHPGYDHYEYFRSRGVQAESAIQYCENVTLAKQIEACLAVVAVNYCTSALLEAAFQGIPCIFIRTAIYPIPMLGDALEHQGVINVHSVEEFETILDRLRTDDSYRNQAILESRRLVTWAIGNNLMVQDNLTREFKRIVDDADRIGTPLTPAQKHVLELENRIAVLTAEDKDADWLQIVGQLETIAGQSPREFSRNLYCFAEKLGNHIDLPGRIKLLVFDVNRLMRIRKFGSKIDRQNFAINVFLHAIQQFMNSGNNDKAATMIASLSEIKPPNMTTRSKLNQIIASYVVDQSQLIQRLDNQYNAILHSKFWKLTAPLRWGLALIRKASRKQ